MSEIEILGAVVWLWMHSEQHSQAPLLALNHLLLPAIKLGQYLLILDGDKPVAFVSWAGLSETYETEYLQNAMCRATFEDWRGGERYWITDWVAPFGHSRILKSLMRTRLFPSDVMRSLYHKGTTEQVRVMMFHGIAIPYIEAQHWWATHPILQTQAVNLNTI